MSVSGSENGWNINVPDEVLNSPLRFPRNIEVLDPKCDIYEALNIISEPRSEDIKIITAMKKLFDNFTAKSHYKSFMMDLTKKMIHNPTNASKIAKYMHLLNNIKKTFILEAFEETMSSKINDLNDLLIDHGYIGLECFAKFFMAGLHFMRNDGSPPDQRMTTKLLKLAEYLVPAFKKPKVTKTFCLLLLRYYYYQFDNGTMEDDIVDESDFSPEWRLFKGLQAYMLSELSGLLFEVDVTHFIELVENPSKLKDGEYVSFLETVLSESDFEDLFPSQIIWVPKSFEEHFQKTVSSMNNVHYK